jgi:hypothetical protein
MSVEADGSGSSVARAILTVGGATSSTYVKLTGGDSLVTLVGGNSYSMARQDALGIITYQASPPVATANAAFRISFQRNGDADAPNSDVTLPAPFTITAPAAGAAFSRSAAAVTVTWNGSGSMDPLTWQISGDCIVAQVDHQISDTGTLIIPAGAIQPKANQGANSCTAAIRLYRTRTGAVDPAYGEGGALQARQTRAISILSTP